MTPFVHLRLTNCYASAGFEIFEFAFLFPVVDDGEGLSNCCLGLLCCKESIVKVLVTDVYLTEYHVLSFV